MTCELILVNENNLIMAADKTTVLNNERIFDDVNKIFDFSGKYTMAVMVYGNPDFMSISMEDFLSNFKEEISYNRYDKLEDLGYSIIDYIEEEYLDYEVDIKLIKYEFLRLFDNFIRDILSENKEKDCLESFEEFLDNFDTDKYINVLENIKNKNEFNSLDDFFNKLTSLFSSSDDYIKDLLYKLFIQMLILKKTGIVIGGYDKLNKNPSFINFELITLLDGEVIKSDFKRIDYNGDNLILAFSQTKEIMSFLSGIHPKFQYTFLSGFESYYNDYLDKLNIIKDDVSNNMSNFNELNINKNEFNDLKLVMKGFSKSYDYLKKEIESIKNDNKNFYLEKLSDLSSKDLGFLAKFLIAITNVKYCLNNGYNISDLSFNIALLKDDKFMWFYD